MADSSEFAEEKTSDKSLSKAEKKALKKKAKPDKKAKKKSKKESKKAATDKRKEEKKQKAMMYSSRIQDGSEAIDTNENIKDVEGDKLEQKVEELNSAIADVRRQLEELGQ
jgi:uncharacterized protein YceH (UPF0502 family)